MLWRNLCKTLLGCHWAQIAKYQWERPKLSLLLALCVLSYNRESCPHLSMGVSKFDTRSCMLVSFFLQFQLRWNISLHWCPKNGESTFQSPQPFFSTLQACISGAKSILSRRIGGGRYTAMWDLLICLSSSLAALKTWQGKQYLSVQLCIMSFYNSAVWLLFALLLHENNGNYIWIQWVPI